MKVDIKMCIWEHFLKSFDWYFAILIRIQGAKLFRIQIQGANLFRIQIQGANLFRIQRIRI